MMMGGVALAMLAALAFVALRGGESRMAFLYTDLDPAAAQAQQGALAARVRGPPRPAPLRTTTCSTGRARSPPPPPDSISTRSLPPSRTHGFVSSRG